MQEQSQIDVAAAHAQCKEPWPCGSPKKAFEWSTEEMWHPHAWDVAPMQGQVVHDVQEMQKEVSGGLRL